MANTVRASTGSGAAANSPSCNSVAAAGGPSVRVAQPPEDAIVLASSPLCRVQAMRVGDRAWSAQYHVELEDSTIPAWGCVPEYAAALERTHGAGALQRMAEEAKPLMPTFKECARRLYEDWRPKCSPKR